MFNFSISKGLSIYMWGPQHCCCCSWVARQSFASSSAGGAVWFYLFVWSTWCWLLCLFSLLFCFKQARFYSNQHLLIEIVGQVSTKAWNHGPDVLWSSRCGQGVRAQGGACGGVECPRQSVSRGSAAVSNMELARTQKLTSKRPTRSSTTPGRPHHK